MRAVVVAVLLVSILTARITARAEAQPASDGPLLMRLAASPATRHAERTRALAEQLTRLLRGLPGVERSEVALALPDPTAVDIARALPPTRASIVLQVRDREPDDATLWQLVHGVLPDLLPSDLTVRRSRTVAPVAPVVVKVGPFRVAPTSATTLRVVLALSLGCNALLAGWLLWQTPARRPSRTRRSR